MRLLLTYVQDSTLNVRKQPRLPMVKNPDLLNILPPTSVTTTNFHNSSKESLLTFHTDLSLTHSVMTLCFKSSFHTSLLLTSFKPSVFDQYHLLFFSFSPPSCSCPPSYPSPSSLYSSSYLSSLSSRRPSNQFFAFLKLKPLFGFSL